MTVTTRRSLLTSAWTSDVSGFETSIQRFTDTRPLANGCEVSFFEIAGDADLHVNVTHRRRTQAMPGWAGPGKLADGYVNNRRFGDTAPSRILKHIRDMVYARTP